MQTGHGKSFAPEFLTLNTRLYGMDAELELKNREKRDPEFEGKIVVWVEAVLEVRFEDKQNFIVNFQSGVLLLKLINVISPGYFPKIDTRNIHLVHHENVNMYLKACWELGIPSSDLFITSDLTRLKDIPQVSFCLFCFVSFSFALYI